MDNSANIRFINAHSKCNSCHDNLSKDHRPDLYVNNVSNKSSNNITLQYANKLFRQNFNLNLRCSTMHILMFEIYSFKFPKRVFPDFCRKYAIMSYSLRSQMILL